MGTRGVTDNFATGGIAAAIEISDGSVLGPGRSKNPFDQPYFFHPVSGRKIDGFQVPFFKDVLKLTLDASKLLKGVRSIGWDIAITQHGPILIEGNDNWCKTVLQVPVGKGYRVVAQGVCDMESVYR
jgi:hypothetical protein